jgi:hypothetical protein
VSLGALLLLDELEGLVAVRVGSLQKGREAAHADYCGIHPPGADETIAAVASRKASSTSEGAVASVLVAITVRS